MKPLLLTILLSIASVGVFAGENQANAPCPYPATLSQQTTGGFSYTAEEHK